MMKDVQRWLRERSLDVQDAWTKHPVIDWVVALTVGGVIAVVAVWDRIDVDPLGDAGVDVRQAGYSAFAVVVSILAAFTTATTTSYVSSDGARQRHMRRIFGDDVRRSLRRAITTSMLVILVLILGIVADSQGVAFEEWRFTLVPAVILGLLRFGRVALLFTTLIALKDADAHSPVEVESVESYKRPV